MTNIVSPLQLSNASLLKWCSLDSNELIYYNIDITAGYHFIYSPSPLLLARASVTLLSRLLVEHSLWSSSLQVFSPSIVTVVYIDDITVAYLPTSSVQVCDSLSRRSDH